MDRPADRVGSGPSLQELRKLAGRVAKFGPACNSARNRAKGVLRNMKLLYFFRYLFIFIYRFLKQRVCWFWPCVQGLGFGLGLEICALASTVR